MTIELEKELGIYTSPEKQLANERAEKERCYKRIDELLQEKKILQTENFKLKAYVEKLEVAIENMKTEVNVIKLENAAIKSGAGIKNEKASSLTPREVRLEKLFRSVSIEVEKYKQEMKQLEARLIAEYKVKMAEAGRISRHQEVLECLHRNNGNVRKTAKELRMSRQAIYQHIHKASGEY